MATATCNGPSATIVGSMLTGTVRGFSPDLEASTTATSLNDERYATRGPQDAWTIGMRAKKLKTSPAPVATVKIWPSGHHARQQMPSSFEVGMVSSLSSLFVFMFTT